MARIQNTDVVKRITDKCKIDASVEGEANNVNLSVQPIISAEPHSIVLGGSTRTSSGATTLTTTSTQKDTYITSFTLALSADSGDTNALTYLRVIIGGKNWEIGYLRQAGSNPTTANYTLSLPFPLKIDKGSTILHSHTTTAGNSASTSCVIGFEV